MPDRKTTSKYNKQHFGMQKPIKDYVSPKQILTVQKLNQYLSKHK
jgi:hypothetical protein